MPGGMHQERGRRRAPERLAPECPLNAIFPLAEGTSAAKEEGRPPTKGARFLRRGRAQRRADLGICRESHVAVACGGGEIDIFLGRNYDAGIRIRNGPQDSLEGTGWIMDFPCPEILEWRA